MKKSNSQYRVKIKLGDAEVEVEGAQAGVVKIVEALSDVLRGSRKTSSLPPPATQPQSSNPASAASRSTPIDIRSFFADKQPSSDVEAAAVAAFYNQYLAPEAERSETIDSESLQEAFRLAKRRLPARTIYTLTNARNAGYLDSGGGPGQFRLNPVGYNLVEHTLGSTKQTEAVSAKPARRGHEASRK